MEDVQVRAHRGYAAIVGVMSAVFGLLAYDVLVAFFPSLGLGAATLSAGGFLAMFSQRLGISEILTAIILLAFNGFIGGIAVGASEFWHDDRELKPFVARVLDTSLLGAAAVGVGSGWMVIAVTGIARFMIGFEMSLVFLAALGNFAIGLIGGIVVAITGIIRPPRDPAQFSGGSGPSTVAQRVFSTVMSKPVTVAAIVSWIVIPGTFIWITWVDQIIAEFYGGIGGGLFFGFWAAFGLAALAHVFGGKPILKAITILGGIPVGAVSGVMGSGLCYSLGGGSAGEISSMAGMFLGYFSFILGGFAGIAGAPFAHFLFGVIRSEWSSSSDAEGVDSRVPVPGVAFRRCAALFVCLLVASIVARFHVESGERLVAAASTGDMRAVQRALDVGALPDYQSMTGWTPLMAAVDNQRPELVEVLLKAGAAPDFSGEKRRTPLHLAAEHESAEMVAALLDAGAEVDLKNSQRGTPLNAGAGDFEVMKLLLDAGADPNGDSPRSPLLTALNGGNFEGAMVLLAHGADPSGGVKDARFSPIYRAAVAGRNELFYDLLARGATLDWESAGAQILLTTVVEQGHVQIIETLLERGVDPNQKLALHAALYNGQDAVAVLLIENGADIGGMDERGRTPLHMAAWRKCLLAAELLLDGGAEVNAQTLVLDTPLHLAVGQTGTKQTRLMIELLVERGADIRIVNDASQSAYDEATTYQKELIRESERALNDNPRDVAGKE